MKTMKTVLLAIAVATVAIGSVYANAAKASSAFPNQPVAVPAAETALPNTTPPNPATGYHFEVLSPIEFHPMFGRVAEENAPYDDVSVGLVQDSGGQIVQGIRINKLAFDMSPSGMGDMDARIKPDGRYAGVYRLKLYPSMPGNWAIHLSAQVPNEVTPIQGTVTVAVVR